MASDHEKAKKSGKKTGAAKYFKDLKSEIKKVTWPSFKKVRNNTFVVLVGMCASAIVIFGIDSALTALIKLVTG
ncbi:MAG: preprotein translocase subunit SecE [Oscillospiraceae bacterium]|nr:preprotein translocase subunit SecE [Oscillospiraceae bacterium]